ncbi:DUF58 domain-containing protein [Thalassotalea sp. PLHSN55]|uniref:DUF58 domain-containing protein n=1 Tax=Thalassotalea sp. PLHSN55 TaxID=3435888 RepID=UPI003F83A65E
MGETAKFDARIYCNYSQLMRLQAQGERMQGMNKPSGSIMSGRHVANFRGRGLNFEELRHYQLGDDIRNVDWKTTFRMGKPYVRSYSEEKDQNVIICVDQRSKMFFSSVEVMKSVVAAEIAAVLAWRVLKDSDRLGWFIASSDKITSSKSSRSKHQLLANLKQLSEANQALNVKSSDADNVSFNDLLQSISRLKPRASTLVIISDWADCNEDDIKCLKHLQGHNNVLSLMVTDPFEQAIPKNLQSKPWVMGDGTHQLQLDSHHKINKTNQQLIEQHQQKQFQLTRLMAMQHLPLIELNTSGDHIAQFIRALGGKK